MRRCLLAALALGIGACASGEDVVRPALGTQVRVRHVPPTRKDLIEAVLASAQLPLSVSQTCTNVGTEASDSTLGRYLAGFLSELSLPTDRNWIETTVDSTHSTDSVSTARVTIRHRAGNDEWGWGVQFAIRLRDSLVLANSFQCTGAG